MIEEVNVSVVGDEDAFSANKLVPEFGKYFASIAWIHVKAGIDEGEFVTLGIEARDPWWNEEDHKNHDELVKCVENEKTPVIELDMNKEETYQLIAALKFMAAKMEEGNEL